MKTITRNKAEKLFRSVSAFINQCTISDKLHCYETTSTFNGLEKSFRCDYKNQFSFEVKKDLIDDTDQFDYTYIDMHDIFDDYDQIDLAQALEYLTKELKKQNIKL